MSATLLSWRRAEADDRGLAVLLALAGAGAVTGLSVAPWLARLAPACVFHALTGLPCPGCGATRAVVALSGGDVGAALLWNPLVTLGLLGVAIAAVLAPPWVALRGPLPVVATPVPVTRLRVAVGAAVGAQWVWLVVRGV